MRDPIDDTTVEATPGPIVAADLDAPAAGAPLDLLTEPVRRGYRSLEKVLARHTVTRVLATVPKTTGFAVRTIARRTRSEPIPGLPDARLTPRLLGSVALDEAILTAAMGPGRFPRRADYERVGSELAAARELFRDRGWIDDPRSYHRPPPPVDWRAVRSSRGWAHRLGYRRISFASEFEPRPDEPGRDRWMGFEANRTAGAWVLQHDDGAARPWLVCIHGFGMGRAFMEFPAFHAAHLHHDLGVNLIGPTLPLHGHRTAGSFSGDQFLSHDLMNSVHGLAQSVWDIRRTIDWVRRQEPEPAAIGLYGVSLGGYTAALVAGIEPDLDLVIAGIPVTDFPALFEAQSPAVIRERSLQHGILGGPAEDVHRVVAPLALAPLVPRERRAIFAGLGDRLAHPRQAHNLWRHWDEPSVRWYPGNHVGFLWSPKVRAFVDETLLGADLVGPEGRPGSLVPGKTAQSG